MRLFASLGFIAALAIQASGQMVSGTSAYATIDGLDKPGSSVTVQTLADGRAVGSVSFSADGKGGTEISSDFTACGVTGCTMNLYSGGTRIASVPWRGPSMIDVEYSEELVASETLCAEEDWWPVILGLAMNCFHFNYSSQTTNGNTNSSFEIGWDCPSGISVSTGGGTYANVSRIEFELDGGDPETLAAIKALAFSAQGGASVTSLR